MPKGASLPQGTPGLLPRHLAEGVQSAPNCRSHTRELLPMKDAIIRYRELIFRGLRLYVAVLIGVSAIPVSFAGQTDEIDVTINGKLKIVQIDHDPAAMKPDDVIYLLEDEETHKTFTLRFGNKAPRHLRSGMVVTVRGRAKGQELLLAADGEGQQSITVSWSPAVVVAGEQKTLVIVGNLADASVTCSVDAIGNLMFNDPASSIDTLYRETSYDRIWLNGQVVGPYNLNFSASTCDSTRWADAADAAARADGIDIDAYSRKVYVLPSVCSVGGLGEVGTNPSRAWVFHCDLPDVFAHELGHNLGMQHAATPSSAYGDISDIMGGSGRPLRQINAPHKEQMGWVPSQELVTVTADGTHDIAPLELDPLNTLTPSGLKIPKPDTGEHYYVSYRQRIGFDANLELFSYLDRTSVHVWDGNGTTSLVGVLADGETFQDSINGIAVTQISHAADHATVQLQFENSCTPALPTVSLSPSSQNGSPGSTLNYTVSVTNTDSSTCPQTTFDLRYAIPFGWTADVSPASLVVKPGSTGQATLSVMSPLEAAPSNYTVGVDVSDANQPSRTASGNATYSVVPQADTTSPTAPSGLSATVRRKGVSLSWSPSQDNVAVSGYHIFRDGLKIGVATNLSYIDSSTGSGTYSYFVEAFDAAQNVSASSNKATVTIGGGSGGGGGKGGPKP